MSVPKSDEILKNVFYHVALPPCLPGVDNEALPRIEANLVARLSEACDQFPTDSLLSGAIGQAKWALQESLKLNGPGCSNKTSLLQCFDHLEADRLLIYHVKEQNSGLLIRRNPK